MIRRWTVWEHEGLGICQVSLCVLNTDWEPLYEDTLKLGPFDDLESGRAALEARLSDYQRLYGLQLELTL